MTRWAALLGSVAVASATLLRPAPALAHTISTDPVAGDFQSRVLAVSPPQPELRLRIVDGDQRLWLSVAPGSQVVVLGVQGEPLLRFAGGRVEVNTRSPTAAIDRLIRGAAPTSFSASARPAWTQVATGQAYMWPEHRIGSLEPVAGRTPGAQPRWSIPILVDGRRVTVTGDLRRVAGPPWWLVGTAILCAAAALVALAWRARAAPEPRLLTGLTTITVAALVVARLGRELYGRPRLGDGNIAEIAVTVGLGALAGYLLVRGGEDTRSLVGLVAGVLGLYQLIRFAPMLTGGLVFARFPAGVERVALAAIIVTAPATLFLAVWGDPREGRQADSVRTSWATSVGRNGAT